MRRLCLAAALLYFGSGCGTLAHGTHQTIHFESKPDGAQLQELTTGETWIMPVDASLARVHHHRLLATMDGYRPQAVYLSREIPFHWWLLDGLTLGIGLVVDALTGGFYQLSPERVIIVLEPNPTSPPPTP